MNLINLTPKFSRHFANLFAGNKDLGILGETKDDILGSNAVINATDKAAENLPSSEEVEGFFQKIINWVKDLFNGNSQENNDTDNNNDQNIIDNQSNEDNNTNNSSDDTNIDDSSQTEQNSQDNQENSDDDSLNVQTESEEHFDSNNQ